MESKHPFEECLDTEQVFVMGWLHDEHRFDPRPPSGRPHALRGGGSVTAAWPEPAPGGPLRRSGTAPPALRLVGEGRPVETVPADRQARPASRHRVPVEVRRRRTLLAIMGVLVVALALPLGGTGGHSHATGSAPAGTSGPTTYTVRPGDTLWSIAERADPSADPRPLVAQLTAQDGSDRVVPGQRLLVP